MFLHISTCIEIRVKNSHEPSETLPVTFVHNDGKKWYWGKSAQYGFHCFNNWQGNGICPDFEFRTC